MINKNEKGFALVLSLVLLLVMSLMGGALIVISSGDHQSNNTSDQYQQAFYVAETGLLEAEKAIINKYMGPYVDVNDLSVDDPGTDATAEAQEKYNDWLTYKEKLNVVEETTETTDINEEGETITKINSTTHARDFENRGMPKNETDLTETECSLSFKNLDRPSGESLKCFDFPIAINFPSFRHHLVLITRIRSTGTVICSSCNGAISNKRLHPLQKLTRNKNKSPIAKCNR